MFRCKNYGLKPIFCSVLVRQYGVLEKKGNDGEILKNIGDE